MEAGSEKTKIIVEARRFAANAWREVLKESGWFLRWNLRADEGFAKALLAYGYAAGVEAETVQKSEKSQ